ncbi:MAG TPA: UDP-N-acetylmuramoyl-L-alanine--D-glutamate ligase [Gemmatimonadales bacterium]|jgi:UDP-N-acetylmuramoylalanine--D-glutamate ligase|nr:UDP-N-acetylmuramoyl-L-alanine--D-glutamate ligase [Gemmatimonadales bacterium]
MSRLDAWRADGREVSVAGLGRSGVAAARLLAEYGIPVYVSDASAGEAAQAAAALLAADGVGRIAADAGQHDFARISRSAALILSPGIPPTAPVVQAAMYANVPVLAEAQLGLDALAGIPYIAVTGTNGKTTTTALVNHLLRAAGRRSVAAGNIGTALSAVALGERRPEWLVVELSSFQLHDMPDVAPTVGVLTNLAPDHLDRYGDLAEYYGDKARLFANAGASSIWVSNLDDEASRSVMGSVVGRHVAFTVARDVHADAWYDHDRQMLMLAGHDLLARAALPLLGDHNVANALAAALAVHATGVEHDRIAAGLASFGGLPHRLELVREVDGVAWINDSKATNVASTRVALQAMHRPFVLLLGGRHKGEPYTALIGPFLKHGVAVIAYGESRELIERDLSHAVRVVSGSGFEDVVAKARVLVPTGGAVLLSPACSSYDMFDNYEQRGAAFRALVEAM